MPRPRSILPWVSLAAVCIAWSSTYLAIRFVVLEVPPVAAGAVRFACAGVLMSIIAAVTERRHGWPSLRQIIGYSIVGVLLLGVCTTGVMWSEKHLASGLVALMGAEIPLWMTVGDALRPGGQPLTRRAVLGCAVGTVGVMIVARPGGAVHASDIFWILVLQGACLAWVVGSLYAKSMTDKLPVFTSSAIEMLAASVALFIVSRAIGEPLGQVGAASAHAWLGLAYLIVFGSVLGFTAYVHTVNELPARVAGVYTYVTPVGALLLGHVFLAEPLPPSLILGATMIFVAVVLCSTKARAPSSQPAAAVAAKPPE